jgi:hypothetical protein
LLSFSLFLSMSSSCVQQAYQDPLSHDGQNIRYVNPSSITQPQQQQNPYDYYTKRQQPHQRRFSYTSMLSDPEQCYLPTISNSSPSNDSEDYSSAQQEPPTTVVSPASVASFIDPIFVDLQTKHHQAGLYHHHQQHSILMDHRSPLHHHQSIQYYDPHQKSFNQHNGNMFNHHHHRNSSPMIHQQSQAGYPISSLCSTPTPTSATIMPHHNHEKYSSRPMTPVSPPLIVKDNHFIAPEDQNASAEANAAGAASKIKKTPRSRGRRVSNIPGCGARMFTCKMDNCGKVFKRSEHLKRHVRSIHTLEKRK